MFWLLYDYIFGHTFLVYIIFVLFIFSCNSCLGPTLPSFLSDHFYVKLFFLNLGMDSDFRKPFPISELLFSWIKHGITWWLYSELPCLFAPSADSTQGSFSPCRGSCTLRTYSLLYSLLFALILLARLPETSSFLLNIFHGRVHVSKASQLPGMLSALRGCCPHCLPDTPQLFSLLSRCSCLYPLVIWVLWDNLTLICWKCVHGCLVLLSNCFTHF